MLKFGTSIAELVRGRNFEISDEVLPDEFYLLLRGIFFKTYGRSVYLRGDKGERYQRD